MLLAKEGKKALVLERHYAAGGFTHTFKRTGGYSWDVGVHYIGRVDDKKAFLRRAFDYITDGKLEWASMGNVYDKAFFGDDEYDFIIEHERNFCHELFIFKEIVHQKYKGCLRTFTLGQ